MAGYKTTPKENWAPREKPKESYKDIIRESKQEWRDTGGKSYSRRQYEAGKQQTVQNPKSGLTTQTLDDYLKSGSTDSTTTQSYLDQVNATLNDPDTSEADYLNNKNYQTALEDQLKADRKREKKADRLAAISGEINDIKNLITGGYNDVQPEEQRWTPPPGYVAGGTDTDEGKLTKAKQDLAQMEWVYNGSDATDEEKAELEGLIEQKKAEIAQMEGGVQTQPDTAADLLLGRRTSGEERAEAQAPTGGKAKEPKPAEPEKPPEEMDREELVEAYQKANDFVEQNAGYVTDPMAEAFFNPAKAEAETLEEEIQKRNKEEGLDVYTDLAGNTAAADAAESFIGERQSGLLSSLGAALGGIDANIGYASEDEKTLNLQWIQAHAKAMASGDPADWAEAERLEGELEALQEQNKGKRHGFLGEIADLLLGNSKDLRDTANEQWADFTADMGGGEKFAWEIAKGSANLGFDMIDNVIVPGSGTMRMFLGAAGGEVQELIDKGIDDPDALFLTAVKGGANAWLSNKLLGGVEAAYGKSILGGLTEKAFQNASPAVQRAVKVLLNTEGAEEGLEDVLNWAGDIILGLDEESRLNFDEVKQDALIGYILGVLTNGLAGGIEYDAAKRQQLAQEAVDFAMSGMTLEEAVRQAKADTVDQVVMRAEPETEVTAEPEETADVDENINENVDTNMQEEQAGEPAEVRAEENAPEVNGRMPTKWNDLQNIVEQSDNAAIQASGTGQYMVYKRGDTGAFRVFNNVEDARAYYNEINEQTAPAETAEGPTYSIDEYTPEQQNLIKSTFSNLLSKYPLKSGALPSVEGVRAKYGLPFDMDGADVADTLYNQGIKDAHVNSSEGIYNVQEGGKMGLTLGADLFSDNTAGMSMQDAFKYIHDNNLKQSGTSDQAGFGPEYTLTHEYGHALARDAGMYGSMENVQPLVDYFNKNKERIREQLSGYATQNWNEMFAEAFAQSFSPWQSDVSKEIMQIYEDTAGKANANQTPLRDRMENDQVTEDEYLNLLQSDEGRQQLADALGIEQTDQRSVASGVALYLMGKEQAASQAEVRAEQQAPTAEQMLLGEETAPEAQTEPVANPEAEQVNTPPETENANTEGLTEPETKGEQNVPLQEQKPDQKRTKISQYFTNTLTESGRAAGLDPVEYNPTSEAESLTNAAMRLSEDKQAVLDTLMKSPAWDNEMVDSAWLLENEFYKEFVRTGDRTNWDAWRKLETYKISQTAKGLQAVAKQSRPGAAGVLEASLKLLEDFRKGGEKAGQVNDAAIAKAEKNVSEVTQKMAKLENDIDDQIASGMSEEEAKATAKSAYLDLAEEINRIRGTGKMFTGDSRFRAMLANQDMDFIQRFVACQAAGIAEDVQYKGKQDAGKKLNTLQKLSQLTGTGTWLRNLSGNASFGLIDLLSNNSPVTLISDAIVGKATGRRSTGFEFGAADKGTLTAAKRALERSILEVAANIDLAEESGNTKYDMARTRTFDPNGKTLSRVLSRWEQWNGYMLTSSDRAFRGGTENSVRNAIIRSNGWDANNLTPQQQAQIDETARQVADYRLFQNQGTAAKAANDLRSTFNRVGFGGKGDTHEGGFGAGTAIMPYTTVPTNIGVKALEFSPAGAVKGLAEMIKVGMDGKNATMAQQNQAVTDFSRGITGTALIVGLAQLMKNAPFFKDWENEDDKDVKAQNKAEGKSGMQFNIDMMLRAADGDNDPTWRNDDRTIDISSLEPVNQLITAASLMAEGEDFGSAVISSAKENFMELPSVSALKNIEDTIRYTNTPDDIKQTALNTAASTAGSVASGFIPAPLRHIATVTDEYARDTSGNNAAERSVNQIKSAIPGLRQTLPVKTDNFGNEVTAGDFSTRFANTYDAFKHGQVNQSEVSREIEQIRNETGVSLMPDRNGPSSVNINGEKIKLSAEDRKAWKDTIGQQDEADMLLLMRNPVYQNADWEMKAELGKNLEEYATDRTKEFYARRNGLDYESRYDYLEDVDNPITWLTTNKAFNLAQSDGKWDVVDQLIGPIRNMTDAERELMRKKNSTAMSYYDYLTPNARGYSVKDAETVHALKEGEKARATARGVQSASGQDTFGELYDGYRNRTYNDQDVDAFMTKQAADGDWDVTKGRAAIYLAVRAGHGSVAEALEAVKNADIDRDGTIDEKGVKIKAEKEGTITLDGVNVPDRGAMWNAFNEIMYPWKVG